MLEFLRGCIKSDLTSEDLEKLVCAGLGYLLSKENWKNVRMCRTTLKNSDCSYNEYGCFDCTEYN